MLIHSAPVKQAHAVRLTPGGDLVAEVASVLKTLKVRFGLVSIIGALGRATLGAYSFTDKRYTKFEIDHEVEILHCTGSVSDLDGKTFAHLHMMVSGHDGAAVGGHVFEGCTVKVAECVVLEFDGPPPVRELDPETGLKLWPVK
jgi:predicted DNA-binding protein with PD1-like motif